MKIQVLGAKVIKGTKDGNSWDMSTVFVQTKIETMQNAKVTVAGFGFEVTEMPLDSECIDQFRNITFPAVVDLEVGMRPRMGKFESYVTGGTAIPKVSPIPHVAKEPLKANG